MKRNELLSAIAYHENESEKMRMLGLRECAAKHCRRVKELKVLLALAD